ncbi:MAG TPA: glycosyltransferase family 2 protein, partial [Acidimicrobiales bacterium]|nr:glycosyltransferase family 2 protein [Acidimicrobiales bacterium]
PVAPARERRLLSPLAADRPAVGSVSFTIPAFNESDCVDEVIRRCLATLDRLRIGGEVVIVDDASTDDTARRVEQASERDERVRLIRSEENVGPQLCIAQAMLAMRSDAAFAIPCDLQVLPEALADCLPAIERADLVMADRRPRAEGPSRRAMAGAFNAVVRHVLGVPVHDVDSSFLARRALVERVVPTLVSRSDFLQAEMLARAAEAGYTIVEVRVPHHPRPGGRASAITPRLVLRTFADLARLAGELRRSRARAGTAGS